MSETLIKKIRKAREFKVKADGFEFTCLRPTHADIKDLGRNIDNHILVTHFVIGWDGVKERDIVPSGGSDEVEFDAALWREWVRDRRTIWKIVGPAILEAYKKRLADEGEAVKP